MLSDDAYKGSEPADFAAINDAENYQWSTSLTDGILNDKWRATYEGVSRTNATLRLLKQVVEDSPSAPLGRRSGGDRG